MTQQKQSILYAVENYGKRLFDFIRNRVKTNEDAEDILQDVWYQLSALIDTEPIEHLSSWLYRVSSNRIIDKKRKKKSLALEDLAFEDEDGELIFPEELLIGSNNPEIEFDNTYFRISFVSALNELPEKQSQVFVWNVMENMTLQEIADKTGESIKTIISRKRYAVNHLRKRLQNIYKDYQ